MGLTLYAEGHRLRFRDPVTGLWLLDPDERVEAHLAAETRAAAETARADQETAARHAADRRAAAAEAELAALRAQLNNPAE